jgi:hypothetical protein
MRKQDKKAMSLALPTSAGFKVALLGQHKAEVRFF